MRPDCREVDPGSTPAAPKLCDDECVNASRVMHLRIRTFSLKMPHVGIDPATLVPATQTIAKRTKRHAEKRRPSSTDAKRRGS